MKKIIILILCLLLLCGCHKNVDKIDDNYRVFYEIFVGSFSDSDGDGIGYLKGIINRLDYLNDGNVDSDSSLKEYFNKHLQKLDTTSSKPFNVLEQITITDYFNKVRTNSNVLPIRG